MHVFPKKVVKKLKKNAEKAFFRGNQKHFDYYYLDSRGGEGGKRRIFLFLPQGRSFFICVFLAQNIVLCQQKLLTQPFLGNHNS